MKSIIALFFIITLCNGFITYPTIRHNPNKIKMNLFNHNITSLHDSSNQKYVIKFIGLNIYQFLIMRNIHIYFPFSYFFADFLYDQTLNLISKVNITYKKNDI